VEIWRPKWKFFHSKFIHKVTTPYPLFQWYPQSTERIKVSVSNAQGSRVNYLSCTRRSSENICSSSEGVQGKEKTR